MQRARALILVAILCAILAACADGNNATPAPGDDSATPAAGGDQVRVTTTISVLADLVRQVGGERVEVQAILPPGISPEDFQPSPQDVQLLADAQIVFYNGYGLEEWLNDLLQAAATENQQHVELAEGLPALDAGEEFAEGNPHFWLDPDHAITYVERISQALAGIDPQGAEIYSANAQQYISQIKQLDQELLALVERIPPDQRKIVTNHDAFPYFAEHYGFTVIGNILGSAEAEPSAGDLAALVERIKQENVKAVFAESQFSPALAQTLADEAGIGVVATLYTDSLDPNAGINSYLDLLRYNVETIVEALGE